MVAKTRLQRIAERIREDLSELLLQEVSDPRLTGIMVTDVEVDRELAYADIFVSTLEGESQAREILQALAHAQGFLRHALAERIDLRTFPRLRFHWDNTIERADKIERLIASLHEGENQPPAVEEDEDQDDDGEE